MKIISNETIELIEALGEIRFALSPAYGPTDRDRIEQALAVVDSAMRPYSDEDLDFILQIIASQYPGETI